MFTAACTRRPSSPSNAGVSRVRTQRRKFSSKLSPSQHLQKRGHYENRRQNPLFASELMPDGHIFDGSTLALWRFDEALAANNAADLTGTYPLTPSTPGFDPGSAPPAVVSGRIKNARSFDGSTNFMYGNGDSAARNALYGEWTTEMWVHPNHISSLGDSLLSYSGGPLDGVGEDINTLLFVSLGAGNKLRCSWHNGPSPTNQVGTTSIQTIPAGSWSHIALRKRSLGAGLYAVDSFFNGAFIETVGGLLNATGGQFSKWSVGVPAASLFFIYNGLLDDVRVSTVPRSDTDILESYRRGSR